MPFINDRLSANEDEINKSRYQKSLSRQSRFRFSPEEVMKGLRAKIIGQENILAALEDMLYVVKADFGAEKQPLSVSFLSGPTGVGKTETVNIISDIILGDSDKCCRVDMNTLSQEHYAAALTGAPPGYVGSKEGYSLFDSEKIKGDFSHPGILLLDEIEKASSEVIQTLLNVLDSGFMALPGGSKIIDFRNTMIFMTSNIGAKELSRYVESYKRSWKGWLGMHPAAASEIVDVELKKKFSPEFLNRIDRILHYEYLDDKSVMNIIDLELEKLNQRLKKKSAHLILNDSAKEHLAKLYNEDYGARNIINQFRTKIEPLLAKEIVNNKENERFTIVFNGSVFSILESM